MRRQAGGVRVGCGWSGWVGVRMQHKDEVLDAVMAVVAVLLLGVS